MYDGEKYIMEFHALQELGADVGINYNTQCFRDVIQQNTSNKKFASGIPVSGSTQKWGVDVILDLVGAVHFPKNLDVLNLEGRLLLVGTGGGVKTEIDSLGKVTTPPPPPSPDSIFPYCS
jgi:NADPH:quinone reductase-like Zn-dependent oxidoreductase